MALTTLVNCLVLRGQQFVRSDIVMESGKIVKVAERAGAGVSGQQVDLGGAKVVSGLLDLHFHGLKDKIVTSDDLAELAELELEFGVTGFLAGLAAQPSKLCCLMEQKRLEAQRIRGAARCLGFYLEVPFAGLSGAIPADCLVAPDIGLARELVAAGGEQLKVVMVGPELPGAIELIEFLVSSGVVVAVGHTGASVDQVADAVDAGARLATHIYNVLPSLRHPSGEVELGRKLPDVTEPGVWPVCGYDALVADDRVTCEIICDGVHVHPVKARITYKAKGVDRLAVITDSNVGAGLPPGRYELQSWSTVKIRANDAVRDAEHGWLAGSALTVDEAVRRAQHVLGCSLAQSCAMASRTVADVLGLGDRLGRIEPGYDADLTVLDENNQVMMTIVAGEIIWQRGDRR